MVSWKQKLSLGIACLLTAGLIAGCGGGDTKKADSNKQYKVGIVQLVEHNALDAANKGFVDGMKSKGIVEGKNVTYDRQNAQADQSNLQNIAQRFVNNKVDLICAIATPAAQSVANATKTIPVVATAVTDFTSAKLVKSDKKPEGNVTGTSDMNPIKEQIDLLIKIFPKAKTIGCVYCSSEVNSELQVKLMTDYAKTKGLAVQTATISTVNDIQQAAQSLLNKVDVFYEPTDNIVASAMPTLIAITSPGKKAVVCAEPNMVLAGGLVTYGIDYYKLGVQTGEQGADILMGKSKPADMPIQTARDLKVYYNEYTAQQLGITIPDDVKKGAEVVKKPTDKK